MIRLRPHHGLCLQNFRGHGYSDAFSVHMQETAELLLKHPETKIRLETNCDELCSACPHRDGDHCTSDKPPVFDRNVLKRTGFSSGEEMTWETFSEKTRSLSLHELDTVCPGCEWLPLCREIAGERSASEEQNQN